MRSKIVMLLSIALTVSACSGSDCLPEPGRDSSPPHIRIVVEYASLSGERQTADHESGQPARTIEADRQGPIIISFEASDSSGLRSLSPGLTFQETVGIGTERRFVDMDPIRANCPLSELSYGHEVRGIGRARSILVTAVSENWAGLTSSSEPLTIYLRTPEM